MEDSVRRYETEVARTVDRVKLVVDQHMSCDVQETLGLLAMVTMRMAGAEHEAC